MKPLLIYDGDCGFCRRWVHGWQARTGDAVEYAPYQQVGDQFEQIKPEAFEQAVQLVEPDGTIYSGAQAVFRLMGHTPRGGACFWCYQTVPGFAPISEAFYRFVANHRQGFSRLDRAFHGPTDAPRGHFLTRWLFIRLLAGIYLIAFASLGVQVLALVGQEGILPIETFLDRASANLGSSAYWQLPTLNWIWPSDAALVGMCWGGVGASVLVMLGLLPGPLLLLLWCLYLSLTVSGQIFLGYQWDALLLEAGFLAVWLAPWRLRSRMRTDSPPSGLILWLLRWLLFRLMLASGAVKLLSADVVWWDLTALNVHYETQPLPTWMAWYAHQLPEWCGQICLAITFAIELVVPFLIFLSGRGRVVAFFSFSVLMLAILTTGNYTFFNWLTLVLCVVLLDDGSLARVLPKRLVAAAKEAGSRSSTPSRLRWVALPIGGTIFLLSCFAFLAQFRGQDALPALARTMLDSTRSFRSVNTYGLFANMTESRPEIIIQGSRNGRSWLPYKFKYKPGAVDRRPAFVAPHQPRLDWQMWFAALGSPRSRTVVMNLMIRLLQESPEVLALLSENPFEDQPPGYIRAVVYDYRFTSQNERAQSGAWWRRRLLGLYARPLSRESANRRRTKQ